MSLSIEIVVMQGDRACDMQVSLTSKQIWTSLQSTRHERSVARLAQNRNKSFKSVFQFNHTILGISLVEHFG